MHELRKRKFEEQNYKEFTQFLIDTLHLRLPMKKNMKLSYVQKRNVHVL